MKFAIGDKVLLKRTGEEGRVVATINKQMIEVEVEGTTFPIYADEVDHPYLKWFTDKDKKKPVKKVVEEIPVEKPKERIARLAKGVYLSFIPVFKTFHMEDVVDHLKVHLLNELPVDIKFSYDVQLLGNTVFSHEGTLHAFGNIYLNNVDYGDMNDLPRFNWKCSNPGDKDLMVESGTLKIKPSKLFEHITNILEHNNASFSYSLFSDFSHKVKEEVKEFIPLPMPKALQNESKKALSPVYELDLHIEKLTSNHKNLSNPEIIKKQLDTLDKYLHLAISNRQERMVIIHGLGEGKLREEVHKILKKTMHVSRFKNEYSGRYGFGATEVHFKY